MFKLIFTFLLLLSVVVAKDILPTFKLRSVGFVSDFVVDANLLYAANDMGTIDVFDLNSKKIINQIILPPVTTAMNKLISANIMSVDYLNGKVLIVSVGKDAYRNVWVYENYELKNIINEEKKLTIKEARFLSDGQIIFGTLGSEVILHDRREQYNIYKTQASHSTLGDIMLSSDKTEIVIADESGAIKLLDAKSSKIKRTYDSQNVDNIFHVAYSNGVVLTAGQDRRIAVYQNGQKDYHIKSNFLVYCVGLSPSAETGVYSSGEEHYLQLFNPTTKIQGDRLVGHDKPVNQIRFINEKELFSSEGRRDIFYWKLD
ncbi:periplasmic protein containing WD40 repeat domain [Sulfurimonas gotlandica GD1]|uniref:Periplasmic protein containing WD40 repeat domain n=1 Tax=Sulfurimonas gotlandica (strain DSM 19862 / JCM 16533 / GD1) TaxID=929558 RepID=B6BJ98_SULGG|nr:nitrate reductase [Sulfurimonas gotlandica]EDZ62915.1 putative periplasmic protein [Sulfurimonas gotlandica GD1]EHP30617.1 periplasmic protein containing WD40 repeat domain [Sulfurimonas gotlandica GD1]